MFLVTCICFFWHNQARFHSTFHFIVFQMFWVLCIIEITNPVSGIEFGKNSHSRLPLHLIDSFLCFVVVFLILWDPIYQSFVLFSEWSKSSLESHYLLYILNWTPYVLIVVPEFQILGWSPLSTWNWIIMLDER